MAALVENLFSVRQTPWHGQGIILDNPPTSKDAIVAAGLNWNVAQVEMTLKGTDIVVPNAYANVRTSDASVLGVVGNRYQIVQNEEAFSFTDSLVGEGCVYETAGSLRGGKQIWLLARLPEDMQIAGDKVVPYLCFTNTHDGSGAVKVCSTPIRVVCNNTLNLALRTAKRTWSARHTGSIENKLVEATETLQLANTYMTELKKEAERLALQKITTAKFDVLLQDLIPIDEGMSDRQQENLESVRNDIAVRFYEAPDLKVMDMSMLRFIHAVSDTSTHRPPTRHTSNYAENNFINSINGHQLLDKAYLLAQAA